MKPRVVCTNAGTFRLSPPTEEVFEALDRWPDGIRLERAQSEPDLRFTLTNQGQEVTGLAFSFVYSDRESTALSFFQSLRTIVPLALSCYLKHSFGGILIPSVHLKTWGAGWQVGYLLFGRSFEKSRVISHYSNTSVFDEYFGVGGTDMVFSLFSCAALVCKKLGFRIRVQLDLETRSYCERTAADFVIAGPNVISLRQEVADHERISEMIAMAQIDEVFHLPARF